MFIGDQEFICQYYALSEEYQECYIAYMVFETKRKCKRKSHLKFVMNMWIKIFFLASSKYLANDELFLRFGLPSFF